MALFKKRPLETNWEKMQKKGVNDSPATRDVFEDQQLDRGYLPQKTSFTSRRVLCIVIGCLVALGVYISWSLIEYALANFGLLSVGPAREMGTYFFPTIWKVIFTGLGFVVPYFMLLEVMHRNHDAQNIEVDTSTLNQYRNDQHIQLLEELQTTYDFAPDAGMHFSRQVSSTLSHMMLNNKGLTTVQKAKRHKKDVYDENGDILFYEGEEMTDDDGNILFESVPRIDEKFGDDLFKTSFVPADYRRKFNPSKIDYNTGNRDRDKLKGYDTWADVINKDWTLPWYETQCPAGVG